MMKTYEASKKDQTAKTIRVVEDAKLDIQIRADLDPQIPALTIKPQGQISN